jgi:hypothetical protein
VSDASRSWVITIRDRAVAHPLITVFLVAFAARAVAAVVWSAIYGGTLFLDDKSYLATVTAYAAGEDPGRYWDQARSFIRPLGWVASVTGARPLILLLMTGFAGSITAVMVSFILLGHVRRAIALSAGLVVALYPSQVLWSSLLLRDAYIWMALSMIAGCLTVAFSDRALWWRLGAFAAIPALWWYISESRTHTFLVAVIATVGALVLTTQRYPVWLVLASITLGTFAPLVAGMGPAGLDVLRQGTSGREDAREGEVTAGATTIDCIAIPFLGKGEPDGTGWRNDLLCAPSGLRLMLLDPFPNQLSKSRSMIPAFAEHLLWYPLLALAAVGMVRMRRWRPEIAYVALVGVGTVTMWALIDRNFGTAYRHRGEFLWTVVVLGAFGVERTRVKLGQQTTQATVKG